MELFLDFDIPIILKTMIHEKKKNGVGVKLCMQLCNDFKWSFEIVQRFVINLLFVKWGFAIVQRFIIC